MAEIQTNQQMTRTDVAELLRDFAMELERTHEADRTAGDDTTALAEADEGRTDPGQSETGRSESGRERAETDEKVTLVVGNRSATINPPETVNFDVEINSDDSLISDDVTERVTFELTWRVTETNDDEFEIK